MKKRVKSEQNKNSLMESIKAKANSCDIIGDRIKDSFANSSLETIEETKRENAKLSKYYQDLEQNHIKIDDYFVYENNNYSGLLAEGKCESWSHKKRFKEKEEDKKQKAIQKKKALETQKIAQSLNKQEEEEKKLIEINKGKK